MQPFARTLAAIICLVFSAHLCAAKTEKTKEKTPPAAAPVTLAGYASKNTISLYTIRSGEKLPPLPQSDQVNNLCAGEKVLTLSGKGLTDINGISKLMVIDGDKTMPLSEVENLHLFLNENNLTRLPEELFGMQNVVFLYLEYNRLEAIPPGIAQMKHLFGMYWTANKISSIPPEVFQMKQLKKFQVSKNKLTRIPENIGTLPEIVHFNFSGNQLTKVPAGLAKLKKLRVCDLSDNQITELPDSFNDAKIYHQLRLRNNPLTTLPPGLANMLATIDITGTKIDVNTLPEALRARISTEKHDGKPKPETAGKKNRSHMEKHKNSQKNTEKTDAKNSK